MADFNLEAMSLKELRQLQKDLAKAISTYEDRHKAEARTKLEAIAKEMGYSLAELMGVKVKTTRAPAVAKYRHPENPAVTWSGRGRKPHWFVDALADGTRPEDLAIGLRIERASIGKEKSRSSNDSPLQANCIA